MRKKRKTGNPKRQLCAPPLSDEQRRGLRSLAERVTYGGNPEHKRNPGDFGLTPPSQPRQGKTLCDQVQIFKKATALALVKEGLRRGLTSVQLRNGWPQNVWAVAPDGTPMEAMLENEHTGAYHGYPMFSGDPMRPDVLERWKATDG